MMCAFLPSLLRSVAFYIIEMGLMGRFFRSKSTVPKINSQTLSLWLEMMLMRASCNFLLINSIMLMERFSVRSIINVAARRCPLTLFFYHKHLYYVGLLASNIISRALWSGCLTIRNNNHDRYTTKHRYRS